MPIDQLSIHGAGRLDLDIIMNKSPEQVAAALGVACTPALRVAIWDALEKFRARTGRQFKLDRGVYVELTAERLSDLAVVTRRAALRKHERADARLRSVRVAELPDEARERHRRRLDRFDREAGNRALTEDLDRRRVAATVSVELAEEQENQRRRADRRGS